MKKILTILLLTITVGAVAFSLTRKSRENAAQADLYVKTSDAAKITKTITIAGDDWLGYLVFRSPLFAQTLAQSGIGVKFEMEFDFDKRVQGIKAGKYQFAAITLDSYLAHGNKYQWPGVILWTVDESFGGDAILALPPITTMDDLDNAEGAYTKGSPSEFFLRSQITNFQLQNLRNNIDKFGTESIEEAYQNLKTGKSKFAVLWEPLKSKALQEIPNTKILIDTTQAQGLIIDVFLASRETVANDPETVNAVAHAYFTTLHNLLNNPTAMAEAALRDINVRDQKKTIEDAINMLKGIHFASLQENTGPGGWSNPANPKLVESTYQLERILKNQGSPVELPPNGPTSILYSKTANTLTNIPIVQHEKPRLNTLYRPLSTKEWEELSKKIKGTLLDTPIFFRPGQSSIPEETQLELQDASPKLAHYPSYRIIVEAHSYGNSPEVDQALSEQRASEVKRYLVWECNIPEERVLAIGKGAKEPLIQGAEETPTAYARRNRRAKILLVGN